MSDDDKPKKTPPERPAKKSVARRIADALTGADEETPTANISRPVASADVPAAACPVCGTLRMGLAAHQPCPVDGFRLAEAP